MKRGITGNGGEAAATNGSSMPNVTIVSRHTGPRGDVATRLRLGLVRPNKEVMPAAVLHSLEHFLDFFLREYLKEEVITVSPTGCQTGFDLVVMGDTTAEAVKAALFQSLDSILSANAVPAADKAHCNSYKKHSFAGAQAYAERILQALA